MSKTEQNVSQGRASVSRGEAGGNLAKLRYWKQQL